MGLVRGPRSHCSLIFDFRPGSWSGAGSSTRDSRLSLPHFSAFDTRVDTPVDTRNDTHADTLTENSICEIPQVETFLTEPEARREMQEFRLKGNRLMGNRSFFVFSNSLVY